MKPTEMDPVAFERLVVARLEPVTAPRSFPYQSGGPPQGSVLFHCDGPRLDEVRERWPRWFDDLAERHGRPAAMCLDLWVQRAWDGSRLRYLDGWDWSFEVGEHEMAALIGEAPGAAAGVVEGRSRPGRVESHHGTVVGSSGPVRIAVPGPAT